MFPKLEEIRRIRLRLGLTQRKLASLVGVSTSLINQIESGRSKPSYDTARRIFEVLNRLEAKNSPKAGDICSKSVVYASARDTAASAAELMRRQGFSQLPVAEGEKVVGLITEEGIMKRMMSGDPEKVGKSLVQQLADASPPIVDVSTPAKAIIPLVKYCKAVLVAENGKIIGIITAADLLKMVE
jgi:predicted transcriptional regulator